MRKIFVIFLFMCSFVLADNPYRTLNNFNAGELSPLLNAREDLAKYQSGCSIMENLIPIPQGGAEKRPGTKFISEVKTSSLKTRLLPFEFSTSQSYIIEAGNQYLRFYTNGAQLSQTSTTDNLQSIDGLIAHWPMEEDDDNAVVNDSAGAEAFIGTLIDNSGNVNTSVVADTGIVGSGSFDTGLAGASVIVDIGDSPSLSFGDGTDDEPFSISSWAFITTPGGGSGGTVVSKWDLTTGLEFQEWQLIVNASTATVSTVLLDQSSGDSIGRTTGSGLSTGWRHIVMTYDGTELVGGITIYIDGSAVGSTSQVVGSYVAMEDTVATVRIGGNTHPTGVIGDPYDDKLDSVAIFNKELTSTEVAAIFTGNFIYEIKSAYLTADIPSLKIEQSADVLYITHPSYETRELSRFGDTDWVLKVSDRTTGPFRGENIDTTKTITASATTGTVTLTAVGHSPFVTGSTAGHEPSGNLSTSKAQTGTLFRLVHPLDTLSFKDTLEDDIGASSTEGVSWMACGTLYKGATWDWVTGGTWLGTVAVQRNYTIGAAFADAGWETVFPFDGVTTARNVTTSGSEDDGDADYRVAFLDDTSGTVESYFTTDQTEHIGIVEITAVASTTSATATVIRTLASTDATYKWSEGSWSNFRGWPRTVTFFEDRLMFGGNKDQPDTIWGSVTGEYANMEAGPDDDEAVIFTLSSRQVNVIEWMVGKDKLLIGTSGAEWTIAGGTDEPLTPSNVIAKQHSTYGSANLQASLANESVLFFQRGAEKMRELAYNWELDSYVAPDMTILANLVTDTGITDTAYQRTPNSILWTTRTDGEMPIFSYERAENITAWSRMITQTNLAGTLTDSDIESVAVINGSPEDEVWVIVERTISGATVRYVEQLQQRDFGDTEDAFFVDAGITYDSTPTTTITGLSHLERETVYVLGDGLSQSTELVLLDSISHWKMNDDAATTAVVDSDGNHNGVASANTDTFNDTGKINGALNMSGTDLVTVSDSDDFSFVTGTVDEEFSLSAWVFVTDTSVSQVIISKSTSATVGEWLLRIVSDETVQLNLTDSDGDRILVGSTVLSTGWHHIAATYDGSESETGLNLYIDGVLDSAVQSESGTYTNMTAGALDVKVGSFSDDSSIFQDKLDDMRVYDKELSQAEVTLIYNGGSGTELSSGEIEIDTSASTVQVGLVYEVQLRTMPLSWLGGVTIQGKTKRISEVVANWYKSGDFSIGRDVNTLQTYSITGQTTDVERKTFPPGFDRNGYIFMYQKSPEPLTVLAVMAEFDVQ